MLRKYCTIRTECLYVYLFISYWLSPLYWKEHKIKAPESSNSPNRYGRKRPTEVGKDEREGSNGRLHETRCTSKLKSLPIIGEPLRCSTDVFPLNLKKLIGHLPSFVLNLIYDISRVDQLFVMKWIFFLK